MIWLVRLFSIIHLCVAVCCFENLMNRTYQWNSNCQESAEGCENEFQWGKGTCRDRFDFVTCLNWLEGCVSSAEDFRQSHLTHQITAIARDCSVCEKVSSKRCYDDIVECGNEFDINGHYSWNADEFYECLLKPRSCEDWEEAERKRQLRLAFEYLDVDDYYWGAGTHVEGSILISALLPLGLWMVR